MTEHLRRLLAIGTVAFALFVTTATYAQQSETKLKITFTDGTQSLFAITEDLRMDFDNQHLLILRTNESPRILHLQDIANFVYTKESSGISGSSADDEPVIRLSAESITINQPGKHICHILHLNGTTLVKQEFVDNVSVGLGRLPACTLILQIDHNKPIKLLVK